MFSQSSFLAQVMSKNKRKVQELEDEPTPEIGGFGEAKTVDLCPNRGDDFWYPNRLRSTFSFWIHMHLGCGFYAPHPRDEWLLRLEEVLSRMSGVVDARREKASAALKASEKKRKEAIEDLIMSLF